MKNIFNAINALKFVLGIFSITITLSIFIFLTLKVNIFTQETFYRGNKIFIDLDGIFLIIVLFCFIYNVLISEFLYHNITKRRNIQKKYLNISIFFDLSCFWLITAFLLLINYGGYTSLNLSKIELLTTKLLLNPYTWICLLCYVLINYSIITGLKKRPANNK